MGDSTTLTAFSISLQDGFLAVSATVEKSGFCWSARGTVGARMRIRIVEGRLQVNTEVDDPDVELDIPWYCYLAAAVIGALGGFLVGGIIGGTVGAVLVPLLLFALEEGLEGTLDGIADNIRNTLNDLAPAVDIPATGINIFFQSVEIDDITIKCRTTVPDLAPIRGAGTVILRAGQAIDLDSGRVGDAQMEGGDLRLDGTGDGRALRTVCAASLARTGRTDFDHIARWSCYGLVYAQTARVASGEMWHSLHLPLIGDLHIATGTVFSVRTGQGRRALVQVTDVRDDRISLRWKTWDRRLVSTRIEGGFKCLPTIASVDSMQFVAGRPFEVLDTAKILAVTATSVAPLPVMAATTNATKVSYVAKASANAQVSEAAMVSVASGVAIGERIELSAIRDIGRVGHWEAPSLARRLEGNFIAASDGFLGGRVHRWSVDGRPLEGSGKIALQGVDFEYQQHGAQLRLSAPVSGKEVAMEISVTVADDQANRADASRCVRAPASCPKKIRSLPKWKAYRDVYLEHVGVRVVRQDLAPVLANMPRLERMI